MQKKSIKIAVLFLAAICLFATFLYASEGKQLQGQAIEQACTQVVQSLSDSPHIKKNCDCSFCHG